MGEQISVVDLLDKMFAATFTRNAGMSSEDFLKSMHIEGETDEDKAVRNGRFSMILACTRELFNAINKLDRIKALLTIVKGEKNDD